MDPRRLLPPLATVTALCMLLTGGLFTLRHWPDPGEPVGPREAVGHQVSQPTPPPRRTTPPGDRPAEILAAWDRARARAWAEGEAGRLADLYTEGSSAGEADVSMLREWGDRGLRVTGLETQMLSLRVRAETRARLVLVVTDRVVGGRVVGAGPEVALPEDRPSTRTIVLRRVGGHWLVAEVLDGEVLDGAVGGSAGRPQRSAVVMTSRTSSSAKS